MKCENCGVSIGAEFVFALKQNKCPACGENIMAGAKLASFLSLQTLLRNNFQDLDAEKAASLIVANFELTQIFKEAVAPAVSIQNQPIEVKEELTEDQKSDEEYKKQQIKESKALLQKMRDEALAEAEADQWGLGNANAFVEEGDVREMAHFQKREQQTENILSGNRGSFRRT